MRTFRILSCALGLLLTASLFIPAIASAQGGYTQTTTPTNTLSITQAPGEPPIIVCNDGPAPTWTPTPTSTPKAVPVPPTLSASGALGGPVLVVCETGVPAMLPTLQPTWTAIAATWTAQAQLAGDVLATNTPAQAMFSRLGAGGLRGTPKKLGRIP